MATMALSMLLEAEFQSCWIKGTSVQEDGLRISIKPLKNETIQFYRTDSDPARNTLSMSPNERRSCDYVVLYLQDMQNERKELLCFLELKGSDFKHAVDQVINTYEHMKSFWKERIEEVEREHIIICVCICSHGSAPFLRDEIRHKKRLYPFFKGDEYIHIRHRISRYTELGQFLRKLYVK